MSRYVATFALFLMACAVSAPAAAQLVEGRDYVEVRNPQPTDDPSRVTVTEFFSYQCPHCYHFYPVLDKWVSSLPKDVSFGRMAISLGYDEWAPMARTFYTLKTMGRLNDELDRAIFRAIHVDRVRLFDEQSIADWLASQGVDANAFEGTYASFVVETVFGHAEDLARTYPIPSIPSLVVDGKYVVPIEDNGMFEAQLEGVDQLIEKAREEKKQQ